jgi:hypothetical protein
MASVISSVVSRLGEMAVAEAAVLRGVDDYIPLLRDKLEWMQTFIQQEGGGTNPYVDVWVRQTREVAYQVEDVLDEFLTKVDLDKAGGLPAWERWLRFIGGCATHVTVRHDLSARMDAIKDRLKEISNNANTYRGRQAFGSITVVCTDKIKRGLCPRTNHLLQAIPTTALHLFLNRRP